MKQRIVNKIFYYSLQYISSSPLQKLFEAFHKILGLLELNTNNLITYHFRPARADMFATTARSYADQQIAIVLQGPVVYEYDFTLETIKIYKKLFPGCKIILSTWEDEKPQSIEKIRLENIDIVLNKKPAYFGNQNINLQIASTKGGLLRAKELKAGYLLKTRTDQRIYDRDALSLFLSLMDSFPVNPGIGQKRRLIATNLITLKYRYYGLSDMLMFGDIEDMERYWDVPMDMRENIFDGEKRYSIGEHAKLRTGEMYFLTSFLEKHGEKLEWTIKHTWQVYKERFCIVDFGTIGMYWLKYNKRDDNKYNYYESGNTLQKLSFAEWLNLYNNTVDDYPESILDLEMGESF